MSRVISSRALQAMLSRETKEVFLICLRLMHKSFSTIRVVNNTQAIERNDGIYAPAGFRLRLPNDSDEPVTEASIQFDNIDGEVLEAIRTIDGRPTVSFDVVLASTPDVIEAGPFNFAIMDAKYDSNVVNCVLGFEEDILSQSVSKGEYNPGNSPGLYT